MAISNGIIPPGLKTLIDCCKAIYPDQTNPLQVTTVLKYWLGGEDPLDYISMYFNKGNPEQAIPPHWHYISFGLSDLHGDGRVHLIENSFDKAELRSGMGFELTFRLAKSDSDPKSNTGQDRPPSWPANLLQALARYCFKSGNRFCPGDNVPWRKALNNSNSGIQHLLIAEDVQLGVLPTPFGSVQFCQIVGVTEEELEQASRWNGLGVLNYLKRDVTTGGEWLVTDMSRSRNLFELFPETLLQLQDDLEKQGSDLAGINAEFSFKELHKHFKNEIDSESLNEQCLMDENNVFQEQPQDKNENYVWQQTMSVNHSLQKSCPLDFQPLAPNVLYLDGLELILAPYAAKFLLLAIKDRIRHGRHFTFKHCAQNLAITFVSETVSGSVASKGNPFVVIGYWIQVLIPDDFIPRMMEAFKCLDVNNELTERKEFDWPDKNFKIIIDAIPASSNRSIEKSDS